MGNKSTKQTGDDLTQLLSKYQLIHKLDPECISLLHNTQNQRDYLLREYTFNDRHEFQSQLQLLNRRKVQLYDCNHLVQLQKIVTHSEDQFCSTHFKIQVLYQWENRSLDDQINQRNLQKRKFMEKELWSIAGTCITALSHLQKCQIKHKSLSSRAILLNQEGTVKLYDPISIAAVSNYETLLLKRHTSHLYLSPQEVDSLQSSQNLPKYNPYKSDIWTLGMILLETGLSQYQDQCYRDEWSRIHWQTLQFNLNRFKQSYSQELVALVEVMLSRQEEIRPDWVELEQRLLKNDQSQRLSVRGSNASNQTDKQKIYQQIIYSQPNRGSSANQNVARVGSNTCTVNFKKNHQPMPSFPQTTSFVPAVPAVPAFPQTKNNFVIISNIDNSRPLRSLFPSPFYKTQTIADQNLIFIPDQYSQISDTPRKQESYFNSLTKQRNESGGSLINKQASAKVFTPYVPQEKTKQGRQLWSHNKLIK